MIKRIIAMTAALIMACSFMSETVEVVSADDETEFLYTSDASYGVTDDGFEYVKYVNSVKINAYHGKSDMVVIPDHIDDLPVEDIDPGLIDELRIKALTIPGTIQIIPDCFCNNNEYIEEVTLLSGVECIGKMAFNNCESLRKVELPDSLKEIGDYCFSDSSIESISVPDSVTRLPYYFCSYCSELKELLLSDNIEYIEDYCFSNCINLNKINLPNKLRWIGSHVLTDCCSLKEIVIPDSVISIGDDFCGNCYGLEKVMLGRNVFYIGDGAFSNTRIKSIDIPASVVYMGSGYSLPFVGCRYLTEVNVDNDNIIYYDFDGVPFERIYDESEKNNYYYDLMNSYYNTYYFDECEEYDEYEELAYTIDKMAPIGEKLLFIPLGKSGKLTFPDSFDAYDTVYIGNNKKISSLSVSETNEKYKSVDGCIYSKDEKELVLVPSTISGTFTIPDSVERIGYAFQNIDLDKLVIPSKVKELKGLSITGKVDELVVNSDELTCGANSDEYWEFFHIIEMMNYYSYDDDDDYMDYDSILKVFIGNTELELPGNCIFNGNNFWGDKLKKITFRSGSRVEIFSIPEDAEIEELIFYPDIDELYIYDGADVKELVLPKGHTVIDNSAFCGYSDLESVYINGSAEIGENAFNGCQNLRTVTINGTSKIARKAFASDKVLKEVNINQKSEIDDLAFYDCQSLENVNISSDSVFNEDCFNACTSLMKINGIEAVEGENTEFASELDEFIRKNFSRAANVGFLNRWILNKTKQVVSEVTDEKMSEVEKAKVLHDWICDNTEYAKEDDDYPENHFDSSVFMDGIAVCEGYARTYNLLLNAAGIETCYVRTDDHAWNIVNIGGKYFHIDSTWDDVMQSYQWFMLSDAQILQPEGTHYNWRLIQPSSLHSFQSKSMPECETVMGDMDKDGLFTQADIKKLGSYIAGKGEYIIEADLDYNGKISAEDISAGYNNLSIIMGDVNEDGDVGLADALSILQYVANSQKYTLTENALRNADVYDNGDGITPMDALAIQKKDAKLVKQLPCSYIVDCNRIAIE